MKPVSLVRPKTACSSGFRYKNDNPDPVTDLSHSRSQVGHGGGLALRCCTGSRPDRTDLFVKPELDGGAQTTVSFRCGECR